MVFRLLGQGERGLWEQNCSCPRAIPYPRVYPPKQVACRPNSPNQLPASSRGRALGTKLPFFCNLASTLLQRLQHTCNKLRQLARCRPADQSRIKKELVREFLELNLSGRALCGEATHRGYLNCIHFRRKWRKTNNMIHDTLKIAAH